MLNRNFTTVGLPKAARIQCLHDPIEARGDEATNDDVTNVSIARFGVDGRQVTIRYIRMNNAIKSFPEKSRRKVHVSSWKVARIARGTRCSLVTFSLQIEKTNN